MSETVQTILSQFDRSIMFLVWVSLAKYKKDKDQWEREIFKQYPDVITIMHLDENRSMLGQIERTDEP